MPTIELRDYQQELYDKIQAAIAAGYRRPLVVAPCGAGKSYLFAALVTQTIGEALILTHRQELKKQHECLLNSLGIMNARVAMVLTEANHLGEHGTPAVIITDEAHLSRSNSWMKVIDFYDTVTVGLTATPIRFDGKPLGDIYDVLIQGVDTSWLIEHERLAPYEYYAPTTVDTSSLRTIAGDYIISDMEQLMMDRAIYGDVIGNYRRLAGTRKAVAYCVSVSHAHKVAEEFNVAGISAMSVSGATPKPQREKIMSDFRSGRIQVLCNVGILSEGVSIDDLSCCILLRPTESVALGIQQMMRSMRYQPKKKAIIIDCVGNYLRVGLPDEERSWSLDQPMHKKSDVDANGDLRIRCCPTCFRSFQTAPTCPFCGAEYPLSQREIEAKADIQIARITAEEAARAAELRRQARMEQGRATSYADLIRLGRSRGYKNPAFWAAKVMRGRKK